MNIVSDTSPINYLILIGKIYLLPKLAGRIIIPQAVYREMQDHRAPQIVRNWSGSKPGWIEVRQADLSLYKSQKNLGAGESEAIALALETHADALLIDDRDGIKEARRQNIPTLSTFGLLEAAAQKNLIDFSEVVDKLSRTNFYLPPDTIVRAALKRAQARRERE